MKPILVTWLSSAPGPEISLDTRGPCKWATLCVSVRLLSGPETTRGHWKCWELTFLSVNKFSSTQVVTINGALWFGICVSGKGLKGTGQLVIKVKAVTGIVLTCY